MVRRWSSYAERPDLLDRGIDSRVVWPEYNLHGDVIGQYWGRLWEERAEFQLFLHDDHDDHVVAEANTVPCPWDGTDEGLPSGLDETLIAAFESSERPGALCALAAIVDPGAREQGLSEQIVLAMRDRAAAYEFPSLIAPVRPSWKERYPLTPIERYATWRDDGQLFDPWMRVHERLGARQGGVCPQSVRITGTVAEWEAWTGLTFPESGRYVFPRGLSTLDVDRDADLGSYWEPNVWFVHEVEPTTVVSLSASPSSANMMPTTMRPPGRSSA